MEMLLTGEMIDAATALEFGLVNRVVPSEALTDDRERALRDTIAAKSPLAVKLGKKAVRKQAGMSLADAYDMRVASDGREHARGRRRGGNQRLLREAPSRRGVENDGR